jgi:putative ABC transport system permease protein
MVRDARIMFRGTPVMVVSLEVKSMSETAQLPPVAGNEADMYRRAAAGEGLIVADNLAQLQRLKLGDTLEVPAPGGLIRLPIVGIIVDYSDQQGTIFMDRSLFMKYWNDDSVNVFRVYLMPNTTVPDVRERILEKYAGQRQVFVLTNRELKSYILKVTDQWFGLTSVQIAVAVLVAILGIVNTLTVSITDRRRELGVLQAVGGLRGQIRRTIWLEALSIGTLGLVLGFALGDGQPLLHPADRAHRHRRHAARLRLSDRNRPRPGADDSRRGVHRGDLAGRVGGPWLVGGGAGV